MEISINWDLYNKRLNINGDTKRDRDITCLKNNINKNIADSPSCKDVKINGIEKKIDFIKTKKDIIEINSLPNEVFYRGDYVEYNQKIFLIIFSDADDEIYTSGKMQECNYLLRWQNSQGDIIERYIITSNASTYNNGESENKTLTIGTDQLMLFIPCDDETIKLRRGKRFFIDNNTENPMSYELTRPDTTTYFRNGHGYICCIVTECQVNTTTDRPDLMICDYFTPSPTPPTSTPVTTYSKITYKSLPEIKLGGNAKSFTVTFYDENNNILTNLTPKWQIKSDFDGVILMSTSNPNVVSLKVSGANSLIGKTFVLEVCDTNDENVSEITITIVSLI